MLVRAGPFEPLELEGVVRGVNREGMMLLTLSERGEDSGAAGEQYSEQSTISYLQTGEMTIERERCGRKSGSI